MTQAVIDCLMASFSEALGITIITAIAKLVSEWGLKKLGEAAGRALLKKVLATVAKKAIPWGVVILIIDILINLAQCLGYV